MTSSYTILLLFQVQIHSTIIFISRGWYVGVPKIWPQDRRQDRKDK